MDQAYLTFGAAFERNFVGQGKTENRSITQTLELGWKALSLLPRSELTRVRDEEIDRYYRTGEAATGGTPPSGSSTRPGGRPTSPSPAGDGGEPTESDESDGAGDPG